MANRAGGEMKVRNWRKEKGKTWKNENIEQEQKGRKSP
jgi:hypothetical protein